MFHEGPVAEEKPPRYTSFILRCWVDGQGEIRCRLVEVGSGISHPLRDLVALPALVKHLVSRWKPAGTYPPGDAETGDDPDAHPDLPSGSL
jgi:hypothetical protein